jgi:hypothetical protein
MQGPKPWIFRYQRLGDELIYGPRLSCGLSGMVRFFCLCRCFCEYRPKGAMFLRRIFVHPVYAH